MIEKLSHQELIDLFSPVEGAINFYYGRVGNGKTYAATADIIQLARRGEIVYANWKIDIQDFDERQSFLHVLMNFVFFRKRFFKFPASNIKYFDPDDVDVEFLSKLANCHVFIDEGQWIFDSYEGTKFSKAKRKLILHTRHYNRTLNIISQRTNAIQVSARANVQRFYKCEKKLAWPFLILRRTEFQDLNGEDVDETQPVSKKTYFASKEVMQAYNTLAMRGVDAFPQVPAFEAWSYSFFGRFILLLNVLRRMLPLKRKHSFARIFKRRDKSQGVEPDSATIKHGERLNTVPIGVSISYPTKTKPLEQVLPF